MPASREAATRARIALQRFGLGPKPGVLERIADNPLAALRAELDQPGVALIGDTSLPSRVVAARLSQEGYLSAESVRQREIRARFRKHLAVEIGFVERLVLFWSNHFSMFVGKDDVIRGMYGQLEREVIRPNALGSFTAMLRGVIEHPAMIRYLDNQDSVGPRSRYGRLTGAGFNENLARELLELHTVGTGGGYGETDVSNMARILTGWSYVRGYEADQGWHGGTQANKGQFIFRSDWHEPGAIALMGVTYADEGVSQGRRAITDLSRRRATAQHIAFKLVRHFIADQPTAAMVEPVANAFHASRGDLKATARALIALPAAWSEATTKIRTPYELAIAQLRALETDYTDAQAWAVFEPLRAMRHLPWERAAPDGYPDENYAWLDPHGVTVRLDSAMLAEQIFGRGSTRSAYAVARSLYGESLNATSVAALRAQPDRRVGVPLFFMSPEFQRR